MARILCTYLSAADEYDRSVDPRKIVLYSFHFPFHIRKEERQRGGRYIYIYI